MSILDRIRSPADLKPMTRDELRAVSEEMRARLIEICSRTGGHIGAGLGVVELTVAIHAVFDTPRDRIVWDVGHQGYPHKLLTGRAERLETLRQENGLSGFLKRSESEYDAFGAGHAGTAISAGYGMAVARDLNGEDFKVVSILGDGALTCGLAYEGLNNAGASERDFIVILNDNEMSIAPNVGAMSKYLTSIQRNPLYNRLRSAMGSVVDAAPGPLAGVGTLVRKWEESVKAFLTPGVLFEELGFRYFGPIDGHDIDALMDTFAAVRDMSGPRLIHCITQKGKGFPAGEHIEKWHALPPGHDPSTGKQRKVSTANAVTFAAGLATEGIRPVCAIYSTFLQRAYDNVIHDVAIQHLPVIFAMDRAGVVGEDGPTHMGLYDIAYMLAVPGMVVTAPKNGKEMIALLRSGLAYSSGPFCLRYPRDATPDMVPAASEIEAVPHATWEVLRRAGAAGRDAQQGLAILAVGTMVLPSVAAADILSETGASVTVVNCRYLKPHDERVLAEIVRDHRNVLVVEEGTVVNGFGAHMSAVIGELDPSVKVVVHGVTDDFVDQAPRSKQLATLGLDARGIAQRASDAFGMESSRGTHLRVV